MRQCAIKAGWGCKAPRLNKGSSVTVDLAETGQCVATTIRQSCERHLPIPVGDCSMVVRDACHPYSYLPSYASVNLTNRGACPQLIFDACKGTPP